MFVTHQRAATRRNSQSDAAKIRIISETTKKKQQKFGSYEKSAYLCSVKGEANRCQTESN